MIYQFSYPNYDQLTRASPDCQHTELNAPRSVRDGPVRAINNFLTKFNYDSLFLNDYLPRLRL